MPKPSRLLSLALSLVLCSSIALAQEGPRLLPVEIDRDIVYGHKMGMALTFDVLQPAKANGAAVLFMVSGGWISRWSPPEQTVTRFDDLLQQGFTVFAVRHGSSPVFKVPDAVEDVRRATRFIRANAGRWEIDADRLGVSSSCPAKHGFEGEQAETATQAMVSWFQTHLLAPPGDDTGQATGR